MPSSGHLQWWVFLCYGLLPCLPQATQTALGLNKKETFSLFISCLFWKEFEIAPRTEGPSSRTALQVHACSPGQLGQGSTVCLPCGCVGDEGCYLANICALISELRHSSVTWQEAHPSRQLPERKPASPRGHGLAPPLHGGHGGGHLRLGPHLPAPCPALPPRQRSTSLLVLEILCFSSSFPRGLWNWLNK